MNASIARAVPVARRLISSKAARWTNVASQSFGGIIARSTTVPTHTASNFNYQGRSSFSTSLVECLTTEITAEIADDEIDHEFLDTKKQTEKLFTIIDDKGVGETQVIFIVIDHYV